MRDVRAPGAFIDERSVLTPGRHTGIRIGYRLSTKHPDMPETRLGELEQDLADLIQVAATYIQQESESDAVSLLRVLRAALHRHGVYEEGGLRRQTAVLASRSP